MPNQQLHLLSLVDTLIQEINFFQAATNLGKETLSHLKNTSQVTSGVSGIWNKVSAAGRHILDVDRNHLVRRAGIELFRTPTGKIVRYLNKPIAMLPVAGAGIYGAIKTSNLKDTVDQIDIDSKKNIAKVAALGVGATALGSRLSYLRGKKKNKQVVEEGSFLGHTSSLLFNPFSNAYFTVKSPLDMMNDTSDMTDKVQQVKSAIANQSKVITGVGLGVGSAALGYQLLKKKKETK